MRQLFNNYANSLSKFSVRASSQGNESVNNMITHKAPKNICYSRSASADYRVASAVCSKNKGERSLISIKNNLKLPFGIHTVEYADKYNKQRLKTAVKSTL